MACCTGSRGLTSGQATGEANETVLTLQARGVRVKRYQMATDPGAFLGNKQVMRLIHERQNMTVLPITVVNGLVIKTESYAKLEEIEAVLRWAEAP